jgi:hypothetical protein
MMCEELVKKIKEQIADETKAPIDYNELILSSLMSKLPADVKKWFSDEITDIISDEQRHKAALENALQVIFEECKNG